MNLDLRSIPAALLAIAIFSIGCSAVHAQANGSQQRQHAQQPTHSRENSPRHLKGRDMKPRPVPRGAVQADPRTISRRQIPERGVDDERAGGLQDSHPGANAVRRKYGTTHGTLTQRRETGQQQAGQEQTGQQPSAQQQTSPQFLQKPGHLYTKCDNEQARRNGWRIVQYLGNGVCLWEVPPEVRARYQPQREPATQTQQGTGSQQIVRGSLLQRAENGR
jgi:hypothetical protein